MQVKTDDRIYLDARAKAKPADYVVTNDYYTRQPQIRLTGNRSSNAARDYSRSSARRRARVS